MKISISKLLLISAATAALSFQVNAQNKATTLDELLKRVQQGAISESKEQRQRTAEFRNKKNEQQNLLNRAKATLASLESKSERLEAEFNKNEEKLIVQNEQLNERLGTLRELFGVLTGIAGDTRGKFETSVISAQYPNRGKFLGDLAKKMGTANELATIDEIERVVYELQREMTESGKVVKFNTTVSLADGTKEEREVVRVGAFNLVSDGDYLIFEPKTGSIVELQRQPESRFTSTASDLSDADAGDDFVAFAVDPSKGSILELLVNIPNAFERIQQGATVGYIIIFVGIIALLIAIQRLMVLSGIGRRVAAQINSKTANENNPLGRVLKVQSQNKTVDTETLELKLNEAILKETPDLMKFINLLKIIAVVAPLMGLLGTVTGMINTFQAITLFGTGDPKVMAGGISQALVTTVLGLCVAIPITLLHSIVNSRSKSIIHILEEQSAGIIAAHNEQNRKG